MCSLSSWEAITAAFQTFAVQTAFKVVAGIIEKVRMLNSSDDPHKARCEHVHPRESRTRPMYHISAKRTE
jgi:hypothetical protein